MNRTVPGFNSLIKNDISKEDIKSSLYPLDFNRTIFNPNIPYGLLYRSLSDENLRETFLWNGIEVEFIDYWPTNKKGEKCELIRACYTEIISHGEYHTKLITIPIRSLKLNSVKEMELWNYLPQELKNELEQNLLNDPVVNVGRPVNLEYKNLPRQLSCSTEGCTNKLEYISPKLLTKMAEKKGITTEEYIKSWKCKECEPKKRGKKVSERWKGYARELICSNPECKFVQSQHPNITDKQAIKSNKTFEEFVKAWKCRKCRKSSDSSNNYEGNVYTTGKKGRQANPNSPWYGKTNSLKCKCGTVLIRQPSIIYRLSQQSNLSYEDYVANWTCKICRKNDRINNPTTTTTTTRRGRKPNPLYVDIPKKTICKVCQKPVSLVAPQVIEKSKKLNITVKELVDNYKCRSCGGKLKKNISHE